MPFFSIIIPTYNRANLILTTLESLLNQTFQDFEVIVIDDGGTDNTAEIVSKFNDSRIQYHWRENAERGASRNFGASLALGKIINFFDSDDEAFSNHLQTAFDFFQNLDNTNKILHTGFCFKFEDKLYNHFTLSGRLNEEVLKHNILSCNNMFIPKFIFDTNKFSEIRDLSASEDWELWIRLALNYEIIGLSALTSVVIQHDNRSMALATGSSSEKRLNILIDLLAKTNLTSGQIENIKAECFSLIALCYSLDKNFRLSLVFLFKSFLSNPSYLFKRRFLATVKHWIV